MNHFGLSTVRRPHAVLFDCDGVVVDSEPRMNALLKADFARFGLAVDEAGLDELLGGVLSDVAARARIMGAQLPRDWVDDFYQRLYVDLARGVPLIPDIERVLDALDAAGIPYGIGSNGSETKLKTTLSQHPDLAARFDVVLSGQTLGRPKPAPDLYLAVATALGVEPADCVVVEDSPTGVRAAAAAGMRCFGYLPDLSGRLEAEGAEEFSTMADLPKLLGIGCQSLRKRSVEPHRCQDQVGGPRRER